MNPPASPLFDEDRCRALLDEAAVDLLLATSRVNVGYLSGILTHVWSWDFPFAFEFEQDYDHALDYLLVAAVARDRRVSPFFVTYYHHVETFRAQTWIEDVRGAGRPNYRPRAGLASAWLEPPEAATQVDLVVAAVRERGLDDSTIGVELRRIPFSLLSELKARLPRARFVEAYGLLERLRAVKTAPELERLRRAYELTERAFREVFFEQIRVGANVYAVFVETLPLIYGAGGALHFSHFFFGTGHARTSESDATPLTYNYPASRLLEAGDMGSVDFGAAYGGYGADVNRSFLVGAKPTRRQLDAHAAVREAREAVQAAVRPGVLARKLYDVGAAVLDRHDLGPALGFMGHGIGLKIHETPWLQPDSDDVIEEGMVISLEPVVEIPGLTLISIEDAVVVTANGCEQLIDLPTEIHAA